jgi:hypothetical protein
MGDIGCLRSERYKFRLVGKLKERIKKFTGNMSVRAFETDVNAGGVKGECPPEFDSVKWHKQMAWEEAFVV